MSDPNIPSNAIGNFIIGVSPIGDLPTFDWIQTVISQYANSPIILELLGNFFQYIDQTQNFDEFYDFIWNVDTAQGYGLDVWGRIVGISRTLQIATGSFFGFYEAANPTTKGFSQGAPFFTGVASTENYTLSDDDYRRLILAKAFSNICDGSIPSINQLLISLFPAHTNAYVTDGEDMTMTYTLDFVPSAVEYAIVANSGVMPTPAGVTVTIVTH